MIHPIVRSARSLARAASFAAACLVLVLGACTDATGPNDPTEVPDAPVVLSNASGLSSLVTEESERIIPALVKTPASEELADRMRLLGDALRTAGDSAVRAALADLTISLGRYDDLTKEDAAAAAELGALRLAVDAVREALQPTR